MAPTTRLFAQRVELDSARDEGRHVGGEGADIGLEVLKVLEEVRAVGRRVAPLAPDGDLSRRRDESVSERATRVDNAGRVRESVRVRACACFTGGWLWFRRSFCHWFRRVSRRLWRDEGRRHVLGRGKVRDDVGVVEGGSDHPPLRLPVGSLRSEDAHLCSTEGFSRRKHTCVHALTPVCIRPVSLWCPCVVFLPWPDTSPGRSSLRLRPPTTRALHPLVFFVR